MESIKLQLLLLFVSLTSAAYLKRNDEEGNCTFLVDVVIAVDGSDSISDKDFDKLQDATVALANTLDLSDGERRMGALVYSSTVPKAAPLTSDYEKLKTEIKGFPHPKMGTSTHKGIEKMTEMFKNDPRDGIPKVGIVITDGRSIDRNATQAAAKEAKDYGIRIIAVGIGHGINEAELKGMASKESDVKMLNNFDELQALLKTLLKKHCVVDGKWTPWSDPVKGQCSATCETGTRTLTYTRSCTNPPPQNGGKNCQGNGVKTGTESCEVEMKCPVDGKWTPWSDPIQSQCSATCETGILTLTYTRSCTNPPPQYGGKNCTGEGVKTETEACEVEMKCPPPSPCSRCHLENGVGYMEHWSNCRYFLQCYNHGEKYFMIKCPRGQAWHAAKKTCTPPASRCSSYPDEPDEPADDTVPEVPVCDGTKKQEPGNSNAYKQNVPNIGWVLRQCSPGTFFNTSNCHCDHGGPPLARDCSPEVYIPFNGNTLDQSGNNIHIQNVRNLVKTTLASQGAFAPNSVLRINRFANMDYQNTVIIIFLMRRGTIQKRSQAIVSNADCGATGSIYVIMHKNGNIEFRVTNTTDFVQTITLPYKEADDGFAKVTLEVADGVMMAQVNTITATKEFHGNIKMSVCALQLGEGTGYESYTGFLDDFKLFLCKGGS